MGEFSFACLLTLCAWEVAASYLAVAKHVRLRMKNIVHVQYLSSMKIGLAFSLDLFLFQGQLQ